MLLLKFLLIAGCCALFACVGGMILYDIYLAHALDRLLARRKTEPQAFLGTRPARIRAVSK